jgi:hypothetical protein
MSVGWIAFVALRRWAVSKRTTGAGRRLSWVAAGAMLVAVTGCAEMLMPRFDGGLLNPDFQLLKAGDVMEGVKCAMVSFMDDREKGLLKRREEEAHAVTHGKGASFFSAIETRGNNELIFSPYHLSMTKGMRQCGYGTHAICPKDSKDSKASKDCKLTLDKHHLQVCEANKCDEELVSASGEDRRLGAAVWDYGSGGAKGKCVPVPDYSRFALDETVAASALLTLQAANTGSVSYTRLIAGSLPFHNIIASGLGPNQLPFPQLSATPKGTTTFEMTGVIPQSIHAFNQGVTASTYAPSSLGDYRIKEDNYFVGGVGGPEPIVAARSVAITPTAPVPAAGPPSAPPGEAEVRRAPVPPPPPPPLSREDIAKLKTRITTTRDRTRPYFKIQPSLEVELDKLDKSIGTAKPVTRAIGDEVTAGLDQVDNKREQLNQKDRQTDTDIKVLIRHLNHYLDFVFGDAKPQPPAKADATTTVKVTTTAAPKPGIANGTSEKDETKLVRIDDALVTFERKKKELIDLALNINNSDLATKALKDLTTQTANATARLIKAKEDWAKRIADEKDIEKQKVKVPAYQSQDFGKRCRTDLWQFEVEAKTRVDFMGLKRMLDNVVERQEERVYRGIPDVTLDQLVLTSSFNFVLDASAGTYHIFRFLPVLVPPTVGLKKEHTHTLKITLKGKKTKNKGSGDESGSKRLIASCQQRVSVGKAEDQRGNLDFCTTEQGQLLEGILQALDKSNSGGAAQ